jgi:hypothetical protein
MTPDLRSYSGGAPPPCVVVVVAALLLRRPVSVATTNSRNALFLNAGTSRYVFTTDVSVNEVQAFIRDLVRVLGWFGPLDRYGR